MLRWAAALRAGAVVCVLLVIPACGGAGGHATPPSPTLPAGQAPAQRPDWFPASFPLPAGAAVASQAKSGGGGDATFRSKIPFAQGVKILDLNLESHGYHVLQHNVVEDKSATYSFESSKYTGSVELTPDTGSGSVLFKVNLKPK